MSRWGGKKRGEYRQDENSWSTSQSGTRWGEEIPESSWRELLGEQPGFTTTVHPLCPLIMLCWGVISFIQTVSLCSETFVALVTPSVMTV